MPLHAWKSSRAGRIVGCLLAGWVAGVLFWAILSPSLLELAEAGVQRLRVVVGEPDEGVIASGTGFVVSSAGHLLTNAHVVEGCGSFTAEVDGYGLSLTLVGTDVANDLAVLRLPESSAHVASLRDGDVRLAETVIVPGYPLSGLLSSTMHVTTGLVSNLSGVYDNTSSFQITAPVQKGNSGSPVLDRAGNVAGVLAAMLDDEETLRETGALPQLVNFVIKASVVRSFLESNSVEVQETARTAKRETEDIAAEAGLYTVPVTCWE